MATTKLGAVDVEVCPACGGLYLDAGELDKVLEEQSRGPLHLALGRVRSIWKG
jgi:Zn-finger nucleic acid-binding protein